MSQRLLGPTSFRQRAVRCFGAIIACLLLTSGCNRSASQVSERFDNLSIRGTPQFVRQVDGALVLLRARAPSAYAIVTNQVGIIRQAEHSGMRADEQPPVFDLNNRSAFQSVTWCAGVIAHDSLHSQLYHDYRKAHPTPVPPGAWTGHDAETRCLAHQVLVLGQIGAPASEVSYCKAIKPDYADVPYEKRNW